VAFFCTAPPSAHGPLARHLEGVHGARVTHVSGSLADRARLRDDLRRTDADVFVVELKAAAVDVVAEEAQRRGVRVVVAANDVTPIAGEPSLDSELERLAAEAVAHAPQVVG
jgi:cyclic 2,3-diphosphoglycerate synthetase